MLVKYRGKLFYLTIVLPKLVKQWLNRTIYPYGLPTYLLAKFNFSRHRYRHEYRELT